MNKSIFNSVRFVAAGLISLAVLSSCKKDKMKDPVGDPLPKSTLGVYVLAEGAFGRPNNSTITYYDIASKAVDKDYFKTKNGIDLGTDANDLKQYGSKMYCVVTGSAGIINDAYVEVINITTGKSIKRISFSDAIGDFHPRYIVFNKNKAYVSSYDGNISKIDTAALTIESRVKVGGALEGMAIVNNKLYVANSSHPFIIDPNNSSVSVLDLSTFTKKTEIPVSFNPTKLAAASNGDVYVITSGQYLPEIKPAFERINTISDTKTQTYDLGISALAIGANKTLAITNYPNLLKAIDVNTGTLNAEFITDATHITSLYALTFNPINNDIFVFDATDYSGDGKAFSFDSNGKKTLEFPTGTAPKAGVFHYSYK
ncbi:YncE family protein [Pedobacter psychroterrae]|uniref:YVTN family beta-propeller protein n=1 Tax=Pedobacter psychroterrae TaxID=2530453 RepID=A0A4R0NLF6_9SPHI|nr:DUF5074 domain-containing protein [Pedobacter psychroterrae]TCD01640.1 hypothetical protein EZ437_13045 [Pedobacter psychroterrae]